MNDSMIALSIRRQNVIHPVSTAEPTVSRWLGAIQDARARSLECIDGIGPPALDWVRDDENTIGSLLYHIAAIEVDWLYVEVLEQPFPKEISERFPHDVREADGRLTHIEGLSLAEHLDRLVFVRELLVDAFEQITLADFHRARRLPDYNVTPEWVLHHLMQHEAEHRGQIGLMHVAAERAFS